MGEGQVQRYESRRGRMLLGRKGRVYQGLLRSQCHAGLYALAVRPGVGVGWGGIVCISGSLGLFRIGGDVCM